MARSRVPRIKFEAPLEAELKALKREIRGAQQQPRRLLEIVKAVERTPGGHVRENNLAMLEVYRLVMWAYGEKAASQQEYWQVCQGRFRRLVDSNPQEAKTLFQFMVNHNVEPMGMNPVAQSPQKPDRAMSPAPWKSMPAPSQVPVKGSRSHGDDEVPIRPRALRYSGCCEDEEMKWPGADACLPGAPSDGSPSSKLPLGASHEGGGNADAYYGNNSEFDISPESSMDSGQQLPLMDIVHPASEKDICERTSFVQEQCSNDQPDIMMTTTSSSSSTAYPIASTNGELTQMSDFSCATQPAEVACVEAAVAPKTVVVNGVSYERVRKIGKGATGKVYEVRVVGRDGPRYALKRVVGDSDAHIKAAMDEANTLRQLAKCARVVRIIDAEMLPEKKAFHIVMELGKMDLGKLIDGQQLGLGDVQVMWRQMLEAVQSVHNARIIHGDLKPGNFLLTDDGLKLIDFGIAKKIACETTHISRDSPQGTVSYIAPEAVRQYGGCIKTGRPYDVWSLGIILYQMVYGQPPFAHLHPAQRLAQLLDPNLCIEFPPGHCLDSHSDTTRNHLVDVLGRCLKSEPSCRATIQELLQHPFLQGTVQQVSRTVFDRVFKAIVNNFFTVAQQATVGCEFSADGEDEDDDHDPKQEIWRALSDQAWSLLSASDADGQRNLADAAEARCYGSKLPTTIESTLESAADGLAPFRDCVQRWVSQGSKRQRVADTGAVGSHGPGVDSGWDRGGPPHVSGQELGHAPVTPQATLFAQANSPMQSPVPAHSPLPKVRITTCPALPPRPPPRYGAGFALAGTGAAVAAETLLKQKSCLKRAPQASNSPAKPGQTLAAQVGNGVLVQRMRERRAIVAEPTEDELTSMTRWGDLGA